MAEQQITGLGTSSAPLNRRTKDSELFVLLAVRATFNGAAAAGSFVPTVEVVSDSGQTVGTFPLAASLAAGDSAEVTFAPFLRSGVGLTGIYYDIDNTGDWLHVETVSSEGVTHDSIFMLAFEDFRVQAGRDFDFDGFLGNDFNVTMGNDVNLFPSNDANIQATNNANLSGGNITNVQGTNGLNLQGGDLLSTNTKVGFFNTTPVAQAATPTTLAQVITILRNLGFAA